MKRAPIGWLLLALAVLPARALVIRHDTPTLDYENYGRDPKFDAACSIVRGDNPEYGISGSVAIDSRWGVSARHTLKDVQDYLDLGNTAKSRGNLWSQWNNTGHANRNVQQIFFFDDDFTRFANAIDIGLVQLAGYSSTLRIAPLYSAWDELDRTGSGASHANNRQDGNGSDRKPENTATSNSPRPYEVRWAGKNVVNYIGGQALGSPNNATLKVDMDHPANPTKSTMGGTSPLDLEFGTMSGDSGSPIYIDKGGVNGQLAGVLSGGTGDAYGMTAFYVRIAPYRTWITDTIKDHPDGRTLTLAPITNRTVMEGAILTADCVADGSDAPPLTIAFSLLTAPTGARIDAAGGRVTWTSSFGQAGQTKTFKVRVADNGIPVKSATQSFTAVVSSAGDTDGDGLPDGWEMTWFGNLARDGTGDQDGDGLADAEECALGTSPADNDTDGDGRKDYFEVSNGFDALVSNVIYRWSAGGDGYSVFQEDNWQKIGGTANIPQINPDVPVAYDLLAEDGDLGGGSGFTAHWDLGRHALSFSSGVLRASPSQAAAIVGSAGSRVQLAGGATLVNHFSGTAVVLKRSPALTFYSGNPLRSGATMAWRDGATPVVTIASATVEAVRSSVLPLVTVDGMPAKDRTNVEVVAATGGKARLTRWTDADGDGLGDAWETWFYGDLGHDGSADADADGASDAAEYAAFSDPQDADSDGDGYPDGFEIAFGFDPTATGAVYRWTGALSGGDGSSVFQEANWSLLGGTSTLAQINPNTALQHDLLATNGLLGGTGFAPSLDLGAHRLSMRGAGLLGQAAAGVRGTVAARLRLDGGTAAIAFLDTLRAECAGAPDLTFFFAEPFTNGSRLAFMSGSSPRVTVRNASASGVVSRVLPSIEIGGDPAVTGVNVRVTVGPTTDVQIVRMGDTDRDGMDDAYEWQHGFNPVNPADGAGDADGDGTPNWVESRLGTPPDLSSAGLTISIAEFLPGAVTLRFGPGGPNLRYRPSWASAPGGIWTPVVEIRSGPDPDAYFEAVHTNASASRAFYRLDVLDDPP